MHLKQRLNDTWIGILTICFFCITATAQTSANFSGAWVLDKEKTKNLPGQLQNYTMSVTQTKSQLTVDSQVSVDSKAHSQNDASGDEFPGRGRGGGFPGGGGKPNGGGRPGGDRGNRGGPSALVLPHVTYSLAGKETTISNKGESETQGLTTVKANWQNNGRVLELQMMRKMNLQGNDVTISIQERWELINGALEVQRTANTPRGSQKTKLIFRKR